MPLAPHRSTNVRSRLVDVAELAGVAVSTASKALHGNSEIAASTRLAVLTAADRLGYRPSGISARLRSGRTAVIGLITPDQIGRFSLPVVSGAEGAFGPGRVLVLSCQSRGDDLHPDQQVEVLLEHGVDGIIVLADDTNPRPSLGRVGVPIVYAYGRSEDPHDVSIIPDEAAGAALAVQHLISIGRTRIAHVTGPKRFDATVRRARASRKALDEARLRLAAGRVFYGEWTQDWGTQAVDQLLNEDPLVDAIFAANDSIARGVCTGLALHGRRIPQDVAVIGFDDWAVVATTSRPHLSSVDMGLSSLGSAAAQALFALIRGETVSGVQSIAPRLILRESAAAVQNTER